MPLNWNIETVFDEMTLPKHGYSYDRVSDFHQTKGHGVQRQVAYNSSDWVKAFCRENNITMVENLSDLGISARKGRNQTHGVLSGFLKKAKDKTLDPQTHFFIENVDRLSRQKPREAYDLINDLIKNDVVIVTTQDRAVYSKHTLDEKPYLMYQLWGAMSRAYDESQLKSVRISDSYVTRRKTTLSTGQKLSGICPAWLEPVRDKQGKPVGFSPIHERVKVVQEIFSWAAEGIGQWTIARTLNDRGEPTFGTPSNANKPNQIGGWRPGYIGKILSSTAVLGTYTPKKLVGDKYVEIDPIPGYYGTAIIDETAFLMAQNARRVHDVADGARARRGKMQANLLNRRCVCDVCGGPMAYKSNSGNNRRFRSYLVCANQSVGHKCDNSRNFNYLWLEETILDHIPDFPLEDLFSGTDQKDEVRAVENEVATATLKLARLEKDKAKIMEFMKASETPDEAKAWRLDLTKCLSEAAGLEKDLIRLRQKRAEAEFAVKNHSRAKVEIQRVREALKNANEIDQLVLRQQLSALVKSVIDQVRLNSVESHVTVILRAGLVNYRFSTSKAGESPKSNPMRLIGKTDLRSQIGERANGLIPREVFTTDSQNVEHSGARTAFEKLMEKRPPEQIKTPLELLIENRRSFS
jgi:hypothetical protein